MIRQGTGQDCGTIGKVSTMIPVLEQVIRVRVSVRVGVSIRIFVGFSVPRKREPGRDGPGMAWRREPGRDGPGPPTCVWRASAPCSVTGQDCMGVWTVLEGRFL